jgi:hypothetical protein
MTPFHNLTIHCSQDNIFSFEIHFSKFLHIFQDVHSPSCGRVRRPQRSQVLRDHRQDGVRQRHRPRSADHREHRAETQEALRPRIRHVDEAILHGRHTGVITGKISYFSGN